MLLALVSALKPAPADDFDWPLTLGWAFGMFVVVLFVVIPLVVWRWMAASDRKRRARIEVEQRQQATDWQYRQEQERLRLEREWQAQQDAVRVRQESLVARFGPENAAKIAAGGFWVGQTSEMLIEALGRPADVEERVLKTKRKHVYKYQPTGANRYALRITLDDGIVVGWDQK